MHHQRIRERDVRGAVLLRVLPAMAKNMKASIADAMRRHNLAGEHFEESFGW